MPFILIPISFLFILSSTNPADAGPACPPRTCNGLTIRNPFWITNPLCGRLGFNLTCHNEKPAISINGQDFLIKNIFYGNNSFLLAKLDMFDQSNTCPTPQHNFTVGGTPFRYGPATSDLFFFYNCTEPFGKQTYTVDCASGHSFAVFHVDLLRHWNYSVESCRPPVNAPVADGGLDELLAMNYTTILQKGFVLQWNESGGGLNSRQKFEIGVVASAICVVVACVTTYHIHRIRRRKHRSTSSLESSPHPSFSNDLEKIGVRIFDHRELEEATDHFNPKSELGDGGYGAVYRGNLRDGRVAAVKRLYDNHDRRVEQFVNEVNILARLRHPNLVSLYGSTSPHIHRDLLLVYEYVPNGTLADHLHGPRSEPGPLPWARRLSIASETASALTFLHASGVVHRDVKSENILLDESFVVKVADFGLSRLFPAGRTHVSTGPQGTPGYVDPEYSEFYELTEKSDVYSFGVVLAELVSSKMAVDVTRGRGEINLATMALGKIQSNALHELVDPEIGFDSDFEVRSMIVGVAELAFRCLQSTKELRPGMREVLSVLEEIKSRDYSGRCVVDVPADDVVLLRNC